jgi:hypothetical protein
MVTAARSAGAGEATDVVTNAIPAGKASIWLRSKCTDCYMRSRSRRR